MCMCVHVFILVYVRACLCIFVRAYVYLCACANVHTRMCNFAALRKPLTCTRAHTCARAQMHSLT